MNNENSQSNQAQTLLSVMRKGSFQLADAVKTFLDGELVIDDNAIVEVLRTIPEQQQVFNNVQFLKNLVNNTELFNKLATAVFKRKDDEGKAEAELRAITKTISTFKNLEKLSDTITLEDYAQFIGADLNASNEKHPTSEKDVKEAIKNASGE